MRDRRRRGTRVGTALALWFGLALAAPRDALAEPAPLRAVATFSILGDLVRQVGGARVVVTTLVGPDADAHGYSPSPGDARSLAEADVVVVNGLGLEGWIDRLIRASGARAPVIVASEGVRTIASDRDPARPGPGGAGHADPHAWQSVANVMTYVANIRDGLARADPEHAAAYAANAQRYRAELAALDADIRAAVAAIPPARRRVITTHDAFGYFADAYGLEFIAPQGVSAESEASPRDVARIIRQIRGDKVPAVFLETVSDPRLMQRIARESGARIGGQVYSDALSPPDGPAPSYVAMMRSNLRAFRAALGPD